MMGTEGATLTGRQPERKLSGKRTVSGQYSGKSTGHRRSNPLIHGGGNLSGNEDREAGGMGRPYVSLSYLFVAPQVIPRREPMKRVLIVTNNPMAREIAGAEYQETDLMTVLYRVRDLVHKGHRLISHPLAGSVKPNETPYKSVVLSSNAEPTVDFDSLRIIEGSIQVASKMLQDRPLPAWDNRVRADFQFIDHALLTSALQSLSHM